MSLVHVAFSLAEQMALAPILLGEALTSTSLVAAESSIDVLSAIFPGSDEASFSLASFVALVKREWNEPAYWEQLPKERYSVTEVAKALVAWGALQGVTYEWKEKSWLSVLKEIDVNDIDDDNLGIRERRESRIRITSDLQPRNVGQIITAEIEDAGPSSNPLTRAQISQTPSGSQSAASQSRLKSNLRRFSKMVLAGYGGAGLIFFGVSFTPPPPTPAPAVPNPLHDHVKNAEENALADAVDASEREASSSFRHPAPAPTTEAPPKYSWWNVLLGRHDREIFEGYAFTPATVREDGSSRRRRGAKSKDKPMMDKPMTAVIGAEKYMPRFWVLTDHGRRQVVLVFRGTMSLNELAVDLTCDPAPFTPASADDPLEDDIDIEDKQKAEDDEESIMMPMPGSLPFPSARPSAKLKPKRKRTELEEMFPEEGGPTGETYEVHSGMLRMAQVMGARGKPVHLAVQQALHRNRGYGMHLEHSQNWH